LLIDLKRNWSILHESQMTIYGHFLTDKLSG